MKELRHDYDEEEEDQKCPRNETEIPDTLIDVDSEQIQGQIINNHLILNSFLFSNYFNA